MRVLLIITCLAGLSACASGTVDGFHQGSNEPITPKNVPDSTIKSDNNTGPGNILPPRTSTGPTTQCPPGTPPGVSCASPCFEGQPGCGVPQTSDSEKAEDVCADEMLYADGACDDNCAYIDRDCGPPANCEGDPNATQRAECEVWEFQGQISDQEADDCRSFAPSDLDGGAVHELAHSLCIERTAQAFSDCVAACVYVYFQE